MSQLLRTFIALEFENSIQSFVQHIQNDLQRLTSERIAWVKPENAHITLKFLGDIDQKHIRSIVDALKNVSLPSSPTKLSIQQLGSFSSQGIPKVIWVGFDDTDNVIQNLFEDIDLQLATLGMMCEAEKFQNHLTIGRVKFVKNVQHLNDVLKHYELPQQQFRVTSLTLFKSTLHSKGSQYEPLCRIVM